EPEIYLGSADWMPRNLYERVEVMFPLHDPAIRRRVMEEILVNYLADTAKSRILNRDGGYRRAYQLPGAVNGKRFDVQEFFIHLAEGRPWSGPAANGAPGLPRVGGAPDQRTLTAKAGS